MPGTPSNPAQSTEPTTTTTTVTTSESPKLSLSRLEKNLPEFLNFGRIDVTVDGAETPIRPAVTKASCPKEVDKAAGTTFRCTVKGTGAVAGYIDITLSDPEGDSFTYEADISGGPFGKFSGQVG